MVQGQVCNNNVNKSFVAATRSNYIMHFLEYLMKLIAEPRRLTLWQEDIGGKADLFTDDEPELFNS